MMTLDEILKNYASNSVWKGFDASTYDYDAMNANDDYGQESQRLYEYAVPDGKGGIKYISLRGQQGKGMTAADGFEVVESKDFSSQEEFNKWVEANKQQSWLEKFMDVAMPLVVGGTMAGGLLNAFNGAGAAAASGGAEGGLLGDGLNALNSFDTGAMANAVGYTSPGMASGAGFTLDQAMLDPTNPASGIPDLVSQAGQMGTDYLSNAMASLPGVAAPYSPSLLDRALNYARENPLQVVRGLQGAAQIGAALSGGGESGGGSGNGRHNPTYDKSIVEKYAYVPKQAPINYQQFQTLALPEGLLGKRLRGILGG